MPIFYEFKSLESIIAASEAESANAKRDFVNADYRISFECLIDNPHPTEDIAALLEVQGQDHIRQGYLDSVRTPGYLVSGIYNFYDYSFLGNCALPIDTFRRQAIIGEPICWGLDFAEWYSKHHMPEKALNADQSPAHLESIQNYLLDRVIRGEHILLSTPGQDIYGHWLLDIAPKLYILSHSNYKSESILLSNYPEWAHFFFKTFDIQTSRIQSHPEGLFKIEKAIVPSGAKSGYRLGGQTLRAAWQTLRDASQPTQLTSNLIGEKIYFTRRHLRHNSRRSFSNAVEVEAHLASLGYKIIAPESLGVEQQISLMKEARIIIGEDGSALHNIIFCESGATLGVLSLPERTNLWHVGICQLNGHKLAYFNLPAEINVPVDLNELDKFVDILERSQVC